MKFTSILTLAAVSILLLSAIEAASENRDKRAVALTICPAKLTDAQCKAYLNTLAQQSNGCERLVVGHRDIEWQSCGALGCDDNAELVPEDLSKPYPDCCPSCRVVTYESEQQTYIRTSQNNKIIESM